MKKIILLIVLGLMIIGVNKALAYSDGDFQVWNTDSEEVKINKDFKAVFEQEFRWGGNAGQFYYQHYDVCLVHSFNKYFDLGVAYRYIKELKNGKFRTENEPAINAIVKMDLAGFALSDRNRFEYRNYAYQLDTWEYRNMLNVKFPWKFTKLQIQPYLADETFFDLNGAGFIKNRMYAGLGFNLIKNLKAEIYYMLQSSKSTGNWTDANVLGTKLKLSF